MEEIIVVEQAMAKSAAESTTYAYETALLGADSRMVSGGGLLATGIDALKAEMARRPATYTFAHIGGRASSGGDMVWTYGSAEWQRDGQPRSGFYVRIWQRRGEFWRLAFDEIVGRPPPPAQ